MDDGRKRITVKKISEDAILAGATDVEALAEVLRLIPDARTSLVSVNWYRSKLRSRGYREVLTTRELARLRAERT